jgi:hypothetical protein
MLAFRSMPSTSELLTGRKEPVYDKLLTLSVLLFVYELQWINLPCPSFPGCKELKAFSVQGVLLMIFFLILENFDVYILLCIVMKHF